MQFLEAFESEFPKPDARKVPKGCKIKQWQDPESKYVELDIGPDFIPLDELSELPEDRALTYRDLSGNARGDIQFELETQARRQAFDFLYSDEVVKHFKSILGEEYQDLVTYSIIQEDFRLVLLAYLGRQDNLFVSMVRECYLAGHVPIGGTGSYPTAYGLIVAAKE